MQISALECELVLLLNLTTLVGESNAFECSLYVVLFEGLLIVVFIADNFYLAYAWPNKELRV